MLIHQLEASAPCLLPYPDFIKYLGFLSITQVWDSRAPISVTTGKQQQEVANGKPKPSVPNGVNGEVKAPMENGAAPAVSYAAKVAQTATEKPALANGVTKTG